MIETCHRRELARVDVWCVTLGDQRVGVAGLPTTNTDVTTGHVVNGFALYAKHRGIGFQQVFAPCAGDHEAAPRPAARSHSP